MVEVAHFRTGITHPSVSKDVLRHIGGGVSLASAKIALDTPATVGCRTYVEIEANGDAIWGLDSPRRQMIRNMFVSKNERQAVREQRRLEIERELLIKLGMNDADSPNGAPPASAVSIDNTDTSDGQTPFGNKARPPSRSMERPGSGRRAVLSSSSGPPRPPKPKPHRPLNLHDESLHLSEPSADKLPEERRWKSALLLVWPDRGNRSHDAHAPESRSHNVQADAMQALDPSSQVVQGCCHGVQETDRESHAAQSLDSCSHGVALSPSSEALLMASSLESSTAYDANDVIPSAGVLPQSKTEAVAFRGEDACTTLEQETDSLRCASLPFLATDVNVPVFETTASSEVAAVDHGERTGKKQEDAEHEIREQEVLPREQRLRETAQLEQRTQELEASAQRLRENVERLRLRNRRSRVFGSQPSHISTGSDTVATDEHSGKELGGSTLSTSLNLECPAESVPTDESARRLGEMRRKIAELDRVNELERQLLEKQEMEVQERRRQQEEFERGLQECTERKIQEHRDREAAAEVKRKEHEEEKQREREERLRRRKMQLHQEEEKSRRLEEQRKEGRSEAAQQKWRLFEDELDRQWADQEDEERRRLDAYAKERRRQFEALDRRLASERQKFASEAEFTEAARHRQARNAAHADEQFYSFRRRAQNIPGSSPSKSFDPPRASMPPHSGNNESATPTLIPDECAVLKELHSMQNQPRDSQKAKVKELLFRWHPDKNPTCADKATRVFQFVQRQREIILGL